MSTGRTFLRRACAAAVLAVAGAVALAPAASAAEPEPPAAAAGPELVGVTVDPATVDVSTDPAVVAVAAHVTGTASPVATVAVHLADDGATVPLSLTSGDATDGTWSGVVTVPAFTPHGTLSAHVDATDVTGSATSVASAAALVVADAPPAAPASVTVTATAAGTVRVDWTAPPANGGSPVDSYDVAAEPAPGSDATALVPPLASTDGAARSVTLDGLSAATRYVVRVAARNVAGAGTPAQADATTDAAALTVPDAPTAVVTVPADRALHLSWAAPASDGGSGISGYEVRATPRDTAAVVPPAVTSAGSPAVVPDLVNGVAYDVAVVARNAAGDSLPGTAAGTPRTVPGAPVLGSVIAGDAAVAVHWSAPAGNGGAAVESYAVTAAPSGTVVTVPGSARSATVKSLPNGVATTFTVVAVNTAGPGAASPRSMAVTPRHPGRLSVTAQPAGTVKFGQASAVGVALRSADGTGIVGQRVDLMARIRPSTTWQRVAYGTTGTGGKVTLRTTLPRTSALRLHHQVGSVAAAGVDVRPVSVATRVSASPSSTRIRLGMTLAVRGGIAPAHPTGSAVLLQRYGAGGWVSVAKGRMTTSTTYKVSYRPSRVASFTLRVVKPADADHATGAGARWSQRVDPENAADISADVLADRGIALARTHESGVADLATARQNVIDLAAGRPARRSSYQNAPGGYTTVDKRLLRALRRMGQLGTVTVAEIAGGSHSRGSLHYSGRALDISIVNGHHVARGSSYQMVVDTCRANGATRVFSPSYDPYGGHSNHVHCDWA
jgi:hypothetical protein